MEACGSGVWMVVPGYRSTVSASWYILVYPLVYPFTIPPPQTEPLPHCGLPRWAEISLQRGLGYSGVEVTSFLGEGVYTELKISSPGRYLPQASDRERYP